MFSRPSSLVLTIFFLAMIGLVVVFEASATESLDIYGNKYQLAQQQAMWMGIGILAFFCSSKLPQKFWQMLAPVFYAVGIVGLFLVFLPGLGVEVNGASRWISLFGLRFQPVELMKIGLVTYFPVWLQKHNSVIPFMILTLLPVILTMLQPDLGSTLILLSISFGLFVLTQPSVKQLFQISGVAVSLLTLLIIFSPYRRNRLITYLSPASDPHGEGYHMRQITIALGNGGFLGLGPGNSMQKYRYIPEHSTDSIFSIIAEEVGFIGSVLFVCFLGYFLKQCFQVVQNLPTGSPEYLLAAGISIWIASQVIINLSAVVALVPLTGIPLPLISRGGTSLITIFSILGILVNLDDHKTIAKQSITSISWKSQRKTKSILRFNKPYSFIRKK